MDIVITSLQKKYNAHFPTNNQYGFTLIELMISLAISLVLIAGIYLTVNTQHTTHSVQEQKIRMNQSMRLVLMNMTKNLRMAGYDPEGTGFDAFSPNAGDLTSNRIIFSTDLNGDGVTDDPLENVEYQFVSDDPDPDNNEKVWMTLANGTRQPIAENIREMTLWYGVDVDSNGLIDENGAAADDDEWIFNNDGDTIVGAIGAGENINDFIRMIRISITARTDREDKTYTPPDPEGFDLYTDRKGKCRLATMTANVRPRNLGLN